MNSKKKVKATSDSPDWVTLSRSRDKLAIAVFTILLLAAIAYIAFLYVTDDFTIKDWIWMSAPLFTCGILYFFSIRMWSPLIFAGVFCVLSFGLGFEYTESYLLILPIVGIAGVMSIVDSLQRSTFFNLVLGVENLRNERQTLKSKLMASAFGLSEMVDVNSVQVEFYKKNRFSVRNGFKPVVLCLLCGSPLFIYITLSPSIWLSFENDIQSFVTFILTTSMYVPITVLTLNLLKTLDIGVRSRRGTYGLYDGAKSTIHKMMGPLFLMGIVLMTIGGLNYFDMVIATVASMAFVIAVSFVSYVAYSTLRESMLVKDITLKWDIFRPVSMFDSLNGYEVDEDVPGIPFRNRDEIFKA